jgi:hypothetical protein
MKKTIIAALLLAAPAAAFAADQGMSGQVGAGLIAGSPTGATAKYWYNDMFAIDGGIGYGNAAVFYADAVFNNWRLLPVIANGSTNLYFSAGPRVASDDGGQFALRTMAGFGFWPKQAPLEFFAELGPTFKLTPDNDVGLDGGVGVRYYFKVTISPVSAVSH